MDIHDYLGLATFFLLVGGIAKCYFTDDWKIFFDWWIGLLAYSLIDVILPDSIMDWLFEWNLLDAIAGPGLRDISPRPLWWHWLFTWMFTFTLLPHIGKLIREQIKKALGMASAGQTPD